MRLSAEVRAAIRKYNDDLLARVRKAPCARCGAKPKEWCTGQYKRKTKGCHWARHNEAVKLGYIKGSWFDCKKYGTTA